MAILGPDPDRTAAVADGHHTRCAGGGGAICHVGEVRR
jgi:hypothetical protein